MSLNTTTLTLTLTLTTVYNNKRPLSPSFSLLTDLSSPPQNPTKKQTKTEGASCYSCCSQNRKEILIKQRPSIFLASSTSGSHRFFNLSTENKASMDHYIAGTLIAAVFLLLFVVRRNDSKKPRKVSTTYKTQNDVFRSSVNAGKNGSLTDVIIVGAGVAGAALAHTLGKVKSFSSLIFLGMHLFLSFPLFWNGCLIDYIFYVTFTRGIDS